MAPTHHTSSRRWAKPVAWAAGAAALTALAAPSAYAYSLHRTVEANVKHASLMPASHLKRAANSDARTYLLIGTSDAKDAAGSFTLAHVSGDNARLDLVALPQSQFQGAYARGGTPGAVSAVEAALGAPVDHAATMSFADAAAMTNTLGAVKVDGRTLAGSDVMGYVHGDGTRAHEDQRQLTFLKAAVNQALATHNPSTISRFVDAATKNVTLDDSMATSDLEGLAKNLVGAQVHTAQLTPDATKKLSTALSTDDMASFAG